MENNIRELLNTNWILVIIIMILILYVIINIKDPKYLRSILGAISNYNFLKKLSVTINIHPNICSYLLNFMFCLNLSLFIFYCQLNWIFEPSAKTNFLQFIYITTYLIIFLLFKFCIMKIGGYIFGFKEIINTHIAVQYIYNKWLGILLLPFICIIPFISEELREILLYIGIFCISIVLIIRFIREINILIEKQFSIFYLILYLCALEILPVFLIGRFLYSLNSF